MTAEKENGRTDGSGVANRARPRMIDGNPGHWAAAVSPAGRPDGTPFRPMDSPVARIPLIRSAALGGAVALVAMLSVPVTAAEPMGATVVTAPPRIAAAGDEEIVQTLFMGTDVVILKDREFFQVQRIAGGSFIIEVKGRPVRVPIDSRNVRMKVEPSLKLSSVTATVDNLRSVRTYTPANNPTKKALAAAGRAAGAAAAADLAMDQYITVATSAQNAMITAPIPQEVTGQLGQAVSNAGAAVTAATAQGTPVGEVLHGMSGERAEELFDAVDVEFELSSATPLLEPHLVVVSRYRYRGTGTGTDRTMIHAQALDPVDHRPRKISIRQTGFPRGFELEEVQVHVYEAGEEVASNVAPNRVPLGREEAFQYLLMEYVAGHKGATLPAVPAIGQLTADVRAQIPADLLDRVFYVKVGKDGRAVEAYVDKAGTVRVEDRYVTLAIKRVLFKPALEKGRPVESLCRFKLSSLPR